MTTVNIIIAILFVLVGFLALIHGIHGVVIVSKRFKYKGAIKGEDWDICFESLLMFAISALMILQFIFYV